MPRSKSIFCKCGDPQHQIVVDADKEFREVIIWLGHTKGNFWKRLKHAFKHVFSNENDFADIVLDYNTLTELYDEVQHAKDLLYIRDVTDKKE